MLLIGAGMSTKCYALASLDDTIRPYVAFNMLYDSNLLRVSNSIDPVRVIGKSDTSDFIKQAVAGFDMDWTVSRQHFIVKGEINQNWFQNFSSLDYTGWNTLAQWDWQMGNNLNGEMGYANIERLGSFSYLNRLVPNLINNQRYFANAGYLFHPNGKIKLGFFRTDNQFVDRQRQLGDTIEDNAELNLQYLSPTGNILGFRFIATDGQFPNRQFVLGDTRDDAYMRFNYTLTWNWHTSEKTSLDGYFGYKDQQFDHLKSRDFADVIGGLNLHWRASEKTLLELFVNRDIFQSENFFASFLLREAVGVNLTWHTTPKIDLQLLTSYQKQQFLGNNSDIANFQRQKNYTGLIGLHLIYSPFDNISVETVLNYENRDSNDPLRSYDSKSAGLNLKAAF